MTGIVLKLHEELGELTQAWLKMTDARAARRHRHRHAARASWATRRRISLCQLLIFARRFDIDLTTSIRRKWLLFDPAGEPAPLRLRR